MPFLSIIIPIYNSEKYLRRCLDSIISQNLSNVEMLLIDDHSTDKSCEIATDYANKYPFIRIIHHSQNLGCCKARNDGIDAAKGQYIIFLDSDDYWISNISNLLQYSNENSLTISGFQVSRAENTLQTQEVSQYSSISSNEYLKRLIVPHNQFFYGAIWNKIFSTKIIKEHNVRFQENIDLCEEWPFLLKYVEYVSHISIVPGVFYSYSQDNTLSLIKKQRARGENWRIMHLVYQTVIEVYQKRDIYNECRTDIHNMILNPIIKELIEMVDANSSPKAIESFTNSNTVYSAIPYCKTNDTFEKSIIYCIHKKHLYLLYFILHFKFLYSDPYRQKEIYYKVLNS